MRRHTFHFYIYESPGLGWSLEVTYRLDDLTHYHPVGQYDTLAEAYGILKLKLAGTESELFDL